MYDKRLDASSYRVEPNPFYDNVPTTTTTNNNNNMVNHYNSNSSADYESSDQSDVSSPVASPIVVQSLRTGLLLNIGGGGGGSGGNMGGGMGSMMRNTLSVNTGAQSSSSGGGGDVNNSSSNNSGATPARMAALKKPKKSTKNPFALKKLQVPTTKSREYEITQSGTFKFDDMLIAANGMKTSGNTPMVTPQTMQQPLSSSNGTTTITTTTTAITAPNNNNGSNSGGGGVNNDKNSGYVTPEHYHQTTQDSTTTTTGTLSSSPSLRLSPRPQLHLNVPAHATSSTHFKSELQNLQLRLNQMKMTTGGVGGAVDSLTSTPSSTGSPCTIYDPCSQNNGSSSSSNVNQLQPLNGGTPVSSTSTGSTNTSTSSTFGSLTPSSAMYSGGGSSGNNNASATASYMFNSDTPMTAGVAYENLVLSKKSKLGSGASATVHRVTNRLDGTPYALKVVSLYETDIQPKQIISEVKSLYESMECPYIIRFYEAFHREGSIKILLEYMDCGSLEDVYKTVGKIPENVLSVITYQILCGLDYLAKKKILHRDIKPSNILLKRDGMAKISDFGMSKQLNAQIQAFKTFIGTYVYMSPERLKGTEHSFESDIWSMGVSIAECAVGTFPFDMKQLGVFDVLSYITDHGLNITEEQVSPEMLDFLKKTTIVEPAQRPNAATLLQHPWITKYQDPTHSTAVVAAWLNDVYRPTRRHQHQLKHSQRKNSVGDSKSLEKRSPRGERK